MFTWQDLGKIDVIKPTKDRPGARHLAGTQGPALWTLLSHWKVQACGRRLANAQRGTDGSLRGRWLLPGAVLCSEAPERDQEGMNGGSAFTGTRWLTPDHHLDRIVFPGPGVAACGACRSFASVCSLLLLTSPQGWSLCVSVPPWQAGKGMWLLS